MNRKLIKAKLTLFDLTQANLADELKISETTLNLKLNGKQFKENELYAISDILHIDIADLMRKEEPA